MEQYIDKSTLVAWINEKKIPFKKDIDDGVYPTYLCALMDFEDFINSLEVKEKEVDLEKEIKEQIDKYYENCNEKLEEMGEDDNDISFLTLDGFARHFYELGLKVQKL